MLLSLLDGLRRDGGNWTMDDYMRYVDNDHWITYSESPYSLDLESWRAIIGINIYSGSGSYGIGGVTLPALSVRALVHSFSANRVGGFGFGNETGSRWTDLTGDIAGGVSLAMGEVHRQITKAVGGPAALKAMTDMSGRILRTAGKLSNAGSVVGGVVAVSDLYCRVNNGNVDTFMAIKDAGDIFFATASLISMNPVVLVGGLVWYLAFDLYLYDKYQKGEVKW